MHLTITPALRGFARRLNVPLAVLLLGSAPALVCAQSEEGATGVVVGRVRSAVSGQYLTNARVTVQGTNSIAFTDDSGSYRLSGVQPGDATLQVYFTGLDPASATVKVDPGRTVTRDFDLGSASQYGRGSGGVVKLDPFIVSNSRVTEGAALAVNEQRFAPNLKNVVSTDAFGAISEGNVAEFMKFLPGISVEYEGDAPTTISVRGFNASMTNVSIDGAQTANAVRVGASREFHFKQVSINNTSRIEVTKVPTPSTPADSLAGSINLVSKSAFERDHGEFNYNLYLSGNSREFEFQQSPHPTNENTYKIVPGVSFDYTLPINEDLGVIITGLTSTQFVANSYDTKNYRISGAGTGASESAPYLQSYSVVDFPGYHNRYSLSGKVDWRATPNSVLSATVQSTYYQDFNGNDTVVFNAGTNGNPSPSSGTHFSYSPDYTIGATGRGAVTMSNNHAHIMGETNLGNLRYRWDRGAWHVDAGLNYSVSRTWRRYMSWGNFRGLNVSMKQPVRVSLLDIGPERPAMVEVYDNTGQPVDYHDLSNYRVTGATANSSGDVREKIASGDLNVRRQLDFAFPVAVQAGIHRQVQIRNKRIKNYNWTYAPPGGDNSATPYLSDVYAGYKNYAGVGTVPWTSPEAAYEAWQKDPSLFYKTESQMVTEEQYARTNSEYIKEDTEAYYLQADMRLFNNRLRVLGGVRYEGTDDDGRGPLVDPSAVYQRNSDGTFALDGSGNRIRLAEAGAPGSLEELNLTTRERAARAARSYDGYYPSIHLTYSFTDRFQVRASYAKTYGRPDFDAVIPNTIITAFDDVNGDPSAYGGTITVRNTGLRPWTADNYDLSAEYYTARGGVVSAGAFTKSIANFYGDIVKEADQTDLDDLGLGPEYLGWTLRTKFNAGDARVSGVEANIRQQLGAFGDWGNHFEVFANATRLHLEGNQNANFKGFHPFTANWGVRFTWDPVMLMANWNHRGEQPLLPNTALGAGGYTYWDQRTTLDLYGTYQISRRLSLFASAQNVFNVKRLYLRFTENTPEYARVNRIENYGVKFSVGIKGTF